ncbi:hypothetical protein [Microbulbifer aggregans]|uniref:hypothetical protein n=1 Tax=Microbulbifer aggregans TaxID=1769779 RepID=UPI001CFD1B02|nr:hypothetical protein [Microbulbifer aggregans]
MNLNQLTVEARLRSNWESVDLGIMLARRHWALMASLWLLPAAVVYLLAVVLVPASPNWGLMAAWWLKPVYDRLPLLVVSRQLFGETIGWRQALAHFRQANARDWLAWISIRRLSFTRAFDMPVTVLEGSRGQVRSARISVLHRDSAGTASWLHIVGAHVEMGLLLGIAALSYLMLPEQLEIDWIPLLSTDVTLYTWITNGVYLLVMAAVAPFYICGGFMLYIGRRVALEAWDIEIQFRKLRERLEKQSAAGIGSKRPRARASATTALLLACSFGVLLGNPTPAAADPVTPSQAQEIIDETLAGEEFHQREEVSGWRLKEFESSEFRYPEWLIAFVEWLESREIDSEDEHSEAGDIGPLLAGIIEVLLWVLAISLVIYLLWHFRHHIRRGLGYKPKTATEKSQPETLFGLDVRRESLPEDVTAEVQRLWRTGNQREALGLLYRATLSNLISRYACDFQDHFTESECAQLVREGATQDSRLQPALVHFFTLLTATWQRQAYAHRAPQTAHLESLCNQWREVFRDEN